MRSLLPGGWHTPARKKGFEIARSEPLVSPDDIAGQFPAMDHPVDCHVGQLQELGELAYGVKLSRTVAALGGFDFTVDSPRLVFHLLLTSISQDISFIHCFKAFYP
jgi:hypothetical protein